MPKKHQKSSAPNDFAIDKDSLDEEWVKQPDLYHEYAIQLADAKEELENARNVLDVTRCEIDSEIRADPKEFDLEKATEDAIKNTIPRQKRYQKALDEVGVLRHKVDVLGAALGALSHKKAALENLVYLHNASYFASPRASGEAGAEMRDVEKRSTRASLPKMTRRSLREEDDEK